MGLGISQKFRLAWLIKPLHSLQIYTVLSTSKETLEIKTQSDGSKILSTYFWLAQNLLKKRGGRVYVAAIRGGDSILKRFPILLFCRLNIFWIASFFFCSNYPHTRMIMFVFFFLSSCSSGE